MKPNAHTMKNYTTQIAQRYTDYSWVGSFNRVDGVIEITLTGTPKIIVEEEF